MAVAGTRAPRIGGGSDQITVDAVRAKFPEFHENDEPRAAGSVSYGVPDWVIDRAIQAAQGEFAYPDRLALLYLVAALIVIEGAPSGDDGGQSVVDSQGSGANETTFAGQLADVRDAALMTNKYGREHIRLRRALVASW